ncbi:MAG: bifunctional phosphopantothenoylcysteine decarboxylase/phosphopantothenate--cysteine ligase CoaBC, partial [Fimbriimonas ginsengisoli]|nr:bifunctional phosphopantothenoylcysteine decarboxylase/phosphopantothenate--cysteine ligase CoaBC [Fimbriimonas ginsengisoli]
MLWWGPAVDNVVLGVCGSVAAYRAADLARELMRRGCTVRVCLTESAEKFVTRALFEALTGQPCLIGAFEEPESGRMAHIDCARQAGLLLIAPATANTIARLAAGVADDMLTTIASAYTGRMLIAPAMNPSMYASPALREALATLASRGAEIVEPAEGDVACGEQGQGKLASVERIAGVASVVLSASHALSGKKVLITSGPTREPIDSVRFVSNRSSGKMGSALARAALMMGADVTVVSGPSSAPLPIGATIVRVETAEEMLKGALARVKDADLVIGAAAVADYRPASPEKGKIRREAGRIELEMVANPDIIAALASAAKKGARVVGFAAEPGPDGEAARVKLARKGLFAIAVNDVSAPGIGFDADENELTLVWADGGEERSGRRSKLACALWLLEWL